MIRPLPTLRIGSAAALALDVEHVRVFAEDAEAFRGVIAARAALVERQITSLIPPHRQGQGLCKEALNLTLDALLELGAPAPDRDRAIRHLELAAAMAITTINTLRQE